MGVPRFRVWDKILRVMNDVVIIDYEKSAVVHGPPDERNRSLFQYVEVMEYTDLKDKNGKEFCEDDIIEDKEFWGDNDYGIVFWNKRELQWYVKRREGQIEPLRSPFADEEIVFQIIGNIHENPKLLAEAQ